MPGVIDNVFVSEMLRKDMTEVKNNLMKTNKALKTQKIILKNSGQNYLMKEKGEKGNLSLKSSQYVNSKIFYLKSIKSKY